MLKVLPAPSKTELSNHQFPASYFEFSTACKVCEVSYACALPCICKACKFFRAPLEHWFLQRHVYSSQLTQVLQHESLRKRLHHLPIHEPSSLPQGFLHPSLAATLVRCHPLPLNVASQILETPFLLSDRECIAGTRLVPGTESTKTALSKTSTHARMYLLAS